MRGADEAVDGASGKQLASRDPNDAENWVNVCTRLLPPFFCFVVCLCVRERALDPSAACDPRDWRAGLGQLGRCINGIPRDVETYNFHA